MKTVLSTIIAASLIASCPAYSWPTIGGDLAKVFEKTKKEVKNAGKDINRAAIDLGHNINREAIRAGHNVNDEAIRFGHMIDENKEAIAVATIVIATGWAVCYDGCTFVGSLLTTAGTIPVMTSDTSSSNHSKKKATPSSTTSSQEKQSSVDSATEEFIEQQELHSMFLTRQYPEGFSLAEFPNGAPSSITYRSLDENLPNIFNDFSLPTSKVVFRHGLGDFEASRNSSVPEHIAHEHGNRGRRTHAGIDFLTMPGEQIKATLSGKVAFAGPMKSNPDLSLIVIEAPDGTTSRILYIHPTVEEGKKVKAGQYIGEAQHIGRSYNSDTVPNHVHVDFTDIKGRRFDPYSNKVIEDHLN